MDTDNLIRTQRKIANRRKRAKAFKDHLEHTKARREGIARIIGCGVGEVDELLRLLKGELRYIKP